MEQFPQKQSIESRLFDREMEQEYRAELTRRIANAESKTAENLISGMLIRAGGEWFALPAALLWEVGNFGVIHRIPFRRSAAVAGVVNVRSRLTLAVELGTLLGLPSDVTQSAMLVFGTGANRTVLLAAQIGRMVSWDPNLLQPVPVTLSKAARKFCTGIFSIAENEYAGVLDGEALSTAIDRSLL